MIVKKMKLVNIRSYKEATIDFPLGKTLFEGDIGSGKSTILMALEFGLFGLGSEKAGSLLRANETEGLVGVAFESEGKEYIVTRHLLKKGKSFNQDDCVLRLPDGTAKTYSATEIKEKILEILDFNEPPDPKAQSVIYRYAIYTPQEEMKSILSLRPDHRLQTLRRAFRLEDYKTAIENSKELSSMVRQRSKEFSAMASDLKQFEEKLEELDSSISEKREELMLLQKELGDKSQLLEDQKRKREELREKQMALRADAARIDALVKLIDEKKSEIFLAKNQIGVLESKISGVLPKITEQESVACLTEKSEPEIKEEIAHLESELQDLRGGATKIEAKFGDYKVILESGVCPTCDTNIEAKSFEEKVAHKEYELRSARQGAMVCSEKLQLSKKLLESRTRYEQAQSKLEDLRKSRLEYEENLNIWKGKLLEASDAQDSAERELSGVKENMQKLEKVDSEARAAEIMIKKSEDEIKEISAGLASGRSFVESWEKQAKECSESIKKKQQQKARSDKLNEYLIWMQDYFVPTLETVEKQVLTTINQEFDSHFQKWFSMLVDDPGKAARVDEEFTPIIQQDGLDQDVSYLSGGEKTSVALAYRLALNAIVRKVSIGMHSNLLILDEPTDGFSKEQLSRVREILDEIQSPQIILVSHERELESFADQIFRVSKSGGESKISVIS